MTCNCSIFTDAAHVVCDGSGTIYLLVTRSATVGLLVIRRLKFDSDKTTLCVARALHALSDPYCQSTCLQCESKNPPRAVFWHFFANGWEFCNKFLHTYYTFLSTLDCKFLFNYLQRWRSYAILSRSPNEFLHFTRSLTSKFAYWANDVTVDVMSYPTCLLTL